MKTIFVFLTILASALCSTLPCGGTFHVSKPKVHAKSSSSQCSSFKVEHHFTIAPCKGGKTPTPVAGPVISTLIVSNPGGGVSFTPIRRVGGGGGGGLNEMIFQQR